MKFNEYDSEELRLISQRAGVASGEARRKKRAAIEREKIENTALREQHRENFQTLREAAKLLLECKRSLIVAGEYEDLYELYGNDVRGRMRCQGNIRGRLR